MDNATLDRRASQLERDLASKIKFYLKVGWLKQNNGAILIVYYDRRQAVPRGSIPKTWFGLLVRTQGILPPGVRPPPSLDEIEFA